MHELNYFIADILKLFSPNFNLTFLLSKLIQQLRITDLFIQNQPFALFRLITENFTLRILLNIIWFIAKVQNVLD